MEPRDVSAQIDGKMYRRTVRLREQRAVSQGVAGHREQGKAAAQGKASQGRVASRQQGGP